MNHQNNIRTLTERFFLGETTLAEEQQLYQLYQREDIPQDLLPYRQMFLDLQAIGPETTAKVQPIRSHRIVRWMIAASLALIVGFTTILLFRQHQQEECVAYIYGKKTTDTHHDIVESQLNEMFNIE